MIFMCVLFRKFRFDKLFIMGVATTSIGLLTTIATTLLTYKVRQKSRLIEDFIRKNNFMQSHYTSKYGLLSEKEVEVIDYYPLIYYSVSSFDNVFRIRFRLDGSSFSRRFRDLEQPLADMFFTICTDKIEERGYITYCFELNEQKQVKIESHKDILPAGENEIFFTQNIVWNWKRSPHLLLVGNTGSGKSQLTQYIISCLLDQNVRVIYCDPKNDDDMRAFCLNQPVTYLTKENEIAKAVRETEEQVRLREKDIQSIGFKEYELFRPIFLIFDELIAFSKTVDKKIYDETARRLAAITVSGRSKCIYIGLIVQRPDTAFIEGAVRDNLLCRISMGEMSEAAYKMTFGPDFSGIKNPNRGIGSGLIYRQGVDSLPRPFFAPYIYKGALNTM